MEIVTVGSYAEMSEIAAKIMIGELKKCPRAVLGLATGSTPLGLYKMLADAYKRGEISFRGVRSVNLDEYVGLGADNGNSYASFMNERLFGHVDILRENTYLPNGLAEDLQSECRRYDSLLDALPRNIQLLGIGSDGHIGFNEPGTSFIERTHIAELAKSTVTDNSRLFECGQAVPERALTMGIADIMSAEKILLLANGKNKAKAVWGMVSGQVTEDCPASILQRHKNVTVVLDGDAASLL